MKTEAISASKSSATFLDATFPLCFEVLVESLFAARLASLDLAILFLEATVLLLFGKHLLDEVALAILVLHAAREVLCRALNDSADLAVLRCLHLAAIFLVMAVGIKHISHLQQLKIPLELWGQIGAWEVVPCVSGSRLFLLLLCQ